MLAWDRLERGWCGAPPEGMGMFFSGFDGIWRTVIVGLCAYACLIIVLRVTGKRALSKMNAFDLVVTVALGSTLARRTAA